MFELFILFQFLSYKIIICILQEDRGTAQRNDQGDCEKERRSNLYHRAPGKQIEPQYYYLQKCRI